MWDWVDGRVQHRSLVVMHESVAQCMWSDPPLAIVSEDVFIGKNAKSSIALARYAQAVISGCRVAWSSASIVPERRIMERDWRYILGLSKSSKDRADVVPGMMHRIILNAADVSAVLGHEPHLFDAMALAYIGLKFRSWTDTWENMYQGIPARRKTKRKPVRISR